MRTAETSAAVVLALAIAWLAHGLGRSAPRRARLRRLVLHRAFPIAATGIVLVGIALVPLLPRPVGMPRRYADYLPDDQTALGTDPRPGWILASVLIGGGVVLLTVWLWLRYAGAPGSRTSWLGHGPLVVGALMLVLGVGGAWIADRMTPDEFGWYLYAPLTDQPPVPPFLDDRGRIVQGVAAALVALGLGLLTALAAFRTGRHEAGTGLLE